MGTATGIATATRRPSWTAVSFVGAMVLTLVAVTDHPPASWDQFALIQSSLDGPTYPAPMLGLTSQIIPAALRLIVPAGALNVAVKLASAALMLGGTAVLARRVLDSDAHAAVAVMLVWASQAPLIVSPSTDVIVGAALIGVLLAGMSRRAVLTGFACAVLALAKPDAALMAVIAAGWFAAAWRSWKVPVAFVASVAALVMPGTLLVDGYWGYSDHSRSWVAFGQHYAATVGVAAIPNGPHPWINWEFYVGRLLPGAGSVAAVVTTYPGRYIDFVISSVRTSAGNALLLFGPLLLTLPLLARQRLSTPAKAALATLVGTAPMILLAYAHVRHLARWYPLAAVAAVCVYERSEGRSRLMALGVIVTALLLSCLKLAILTGYVY